MIYMRGQAADYDHWRQLGLAGWGWDDVLPFFKRHEDHFLGPSASHGVGGEWRVEPPRVRWALLEAFRDAATQAGIKPIPDFNTGDNEGSCYFHVNQKRGRRWSAARGFLKPVLSRPNLRLETGCLVTGIAFEGQRAVAVRWSCSDRRQDTARPLPRRDYPRRRRHRLAASPAVVRRRAGGALREHGIPVVLDRPGVGENLQDHLQLRAIYKVTGAQDAQRNLSYPCRPHRHGAAIRFPAPRPPDHGAVAARPVHALRSRRASAPTSSSTSSPCRSIASASRCTPFPPSPRASCNVQPESRGHLRLRSADPAAPPAIKPNYLATDEDRRVAADSIRTVRRIVAQPALAPFRPQEYLPGAAVGDDEASLIKAAGDVGTTIFHPVGTAKMGRDSDPKAVVDADLAGDRPRPPAGDRCIGHADHHLGQHRRADHDDCGEGCGVDPRRSASWSPAPKWRGVRSIGRGDGG